jgi:hypothetical protein
VTSIRAWLLVAENQPVFGRRAYQPGQVANIQLGHQVGPVLLDGSDADLQQLGDGGVGVPFGNELQDLALALRKPVEQGGPFSLLAARMASSSSSATERLSK